MRPGLRVKRGFTLVELLAVMGLIILVVAMAVPNFASMVREQRWSAAVGQLQNAVLRVKTYCIAARYDHSIEFCQDARGVYYLRLEAESALLERIPNLANYYAMVGGFQNFPEGWEDVFMAKRNAWGSDGVQLRSGIVDVFYPLARCPCWYGASHSDYPKNQGWGHFYPFHSWGGADWWEARFYYDGRNGYLPKDQLPPPPAWARYSVGEPANVSGQTGYQDVDDNIWVSGENHIRVADNLAVDDFIYLPYGIELDATKSVNLINYDSQAGCVHGWDNTPDLRFDKLGFLMQSQTPDIVLKRMVSNQPEYMRLRMLRGTGRLQKLE